MGSYISSAAKTPQVAANGIVISFDKPPILIEDLVYIQLRPLLTQLGWSISWFAESGSIVAVKRETTITFKLNSIFIDVNGLTYNIGKPVRVEEGSAFFSPQSMADLLGIETVWNSFSSTLHIKSTLSMYILDELSSGKLTYEGGTVPSDIQGNGSLERGDELFYKGEFKNNKLAGIGAVYNFGKLIYKGLFQNNLPNGNGIYYYPNGDTYKGGFKDGLREGHGSLTLQGTIVYEGLWIAGSKEGIGKLYTASGLKEYEGELLAGVRNGYGVQYDKNGKRIYSGNWLNNVKHGFGKAFDSTTGKIVYSGNWSNNVRSDKGTKYYAYKSTIYTFDDFGNVSKEAVEKEAVDYFEVIYKDRIEISSRMSLRYIGDIDEEGLPHGKGSIGYPALDSSIEAGLLQHTQYYYHGDFDHGKLLGKGILLDSNEEVIYNGDVVDGKREGNGKVYRDKQLIYDGAIHNEIYNGNGTSYVNNKKSYEGNWVNGIQNGQGIQYDVNANKIFSGTWQHGTIVGQGKSYDPNTGRLTYHGEWSNNQRKGLGTSYSYSKGYLYTTDNTTLVNTVILKEKVYMVDGTFDGDQVSPTRTLIYVGDLNAIGLPNGQGSIGTPKKNVAALREADYYYSGQFSLGKATGKGKILDSNQIVIYDGEVVDGKRQGSGQAFANGKLQYDGAYKNDQRNGFGILYDVDGLTMIYLGNFINDLPAIE